MTTPSRLTRRRSLGARPFAALALRLSLVGSLATSLAGSLAGCGDGRTPLVLYSPHGRDLLALVEKTYEAENPTIDVRWLDMGSQEVYDRIRSEKANPQADVWFGGPQPIFAQGAADGLLAPFRPSWAEAIAPASRAEGDLYFGLYRTAPVLVFQSQLVSDAEAPADWEDLLAPRFRGKVLMRDPLASGTMRTLFGMVLARSLAETGAEDRGWEWLAALDAQTKEYVLNPALLIEKLNRGEGLVTVWELTDMLWQRERGAPLGFRFPSSGTPIIDDSIGLVERAPHAVEARAFIEWVGSPAAQTLAARDAFRLPGRTDIAEADLPAWAQDVLAEMKPAAVDGKILAARSKDWMARWDREIRGRSPKQPGRSPKQL